MVLGGDRHDQRLPHGINQTNGDIAVAMLPGNFEYQVTLRAKALSRMVAETI